MTTPSSRPAASPQSAGFFFVFLIFALIGGDYYTLINKQEIAELRAKQLTQPKLEALASDAGKGRAPGGVSKAQAPTQAGTGRAAGTAAGVDALAHAGEGIQAKLLVGAARFYDRAGRWVRVLLLLGGLVLVFVQKTPQDVPSKPRPRPVDPKALRIVAGACAGVFLIAGYILLNAQNYTPSFVEVGYPGAAVAALASGGLVGLLWASSKRPKFGLTTERKKVETPDSIYFSTADGGWITIANPYRGTLVLGGAGAGKSYSIGEPLIEQFAAKNFAGLIYDFKFPVLAEVAHKALVLAERKKREEKAAAEKAANSLAGKVTGWLHKKEPVGEEPAIEFHLINFRDLTRSERVNPLLPSEMPVVAYAEEYSRAIINNLDTDSIRTKNFFNTSAISYLTSIIWFYRTHFPQYCTIPHVVATAMHSDYTHVLSMLETDLQCADLARSLISAVQENIAKQVGGVVSTLQNILTRINSPEMVWVLTPDAKRGEGFSLNLNDPEHPKLLCIGNDPTLKDTFSPVVSAILTVCLKLMNQQNKHRSYVFLDEAATLYVPGLEVLPATARSNKVAVIFMTQGFPQMTDLYGRDKMMVLIDNFNNQFFGKVNSVETGKFISELIGREDKEMVSTSTGSSMGGTGHRNNSTNQSTSYQERSLVRIQDTVKLRQGEFIGQTVETAETFFQGTITRPDATKERFPIHPIATFGGEGEDPNAVLARLVQENFLAVRRQVQATLALHVNTLAEARDARNTNN